ncbi:hypothetical protein J3A83DRAFT_2534153 [Scleroderma citrinum]
MPVQINYTLTGTRIHLRWLGIQLVFVHHIILSLGPFIVPSLMSLQLDINVAFAGVDFTLLVYDYTLTLRREVELFWEKPRYSWGFSLFVANRYITILDHALQVTYSFWSPEIYSNFSVCNIHRRPEIILHSDCNPETSGVDPSAWLSNQ